MKRRTLIVLVLVALVGLSIVAFSFFIARPPKTFALSDEEVERVVAELFKVDDLGIKVAVPPTEIPPDYIPNILDALRPITAREYPGRWDEWATLGKLTIKRRDGTSVEFLFPYCGQNPLCYKYNGVRCIRGGQYEPGVDLGYCDESLMFATAIREIYHEVTTGKKSQILTDVLHDLERSAGKRSPR